MPTHPSDFSATVQKLLAQDKAWLEQTAIPVVTVSAHQLEDLKGWHGLAEDETKHDVVFSRAHYSMVAGFLVEAWGWQPGQGAPKLDPAKAWAVDPTNYVSQKEWSKIQLTETIGKTIARFPLLKMVKDVIDTFGRSKLPILNSITPPLLYLFQDVHRPIMSFHIAAGNILLSQGKKVIQVITDPHVRDEYLQHAGNPNLTLCVFDEKTKMDALEKATILGKVMDPDKIIVTGPPIDPRIKAARQHKQPWRSGTLKLCMTTGGLGTNKPELQKIFAQLAPELRRRDSQLQLMIYTGTQPDIQNLFLRLAKQERLKPYVITDSETARHKHHLTNQKLILLHHPQLVDANELLLRYAFPWADGFITKPSGDMAYDAAASGSFVLTLQEWGEWEHHVRAFFEQQGVSRTADISHIVEQLTALQQAPSQSQSWIEQAMLATYKLPKPFFDGTQNLENIMRNANRHR